MITVKLTPLLLAAALAFPAYAAEAENDRTTAAEVREEMSDAAEAIGSYAADKRDEAVTQAEAALDVLDARIQALEARIDTKWEKMDQATREQARRTLQTLREQRVEVAEWYGGLKASTAEAWEHMKAGFTNAYRSLGQAWQKAEQEYRDDEAK